MCVSRRFVQRLAVFFALLGQVAMFGIYFSQSAHAAPTISLPSTLQASTSFINVNTAGALSVSGYNVGDSVQVTIGVDSGYVKIGTTTGLTAPTGYTSSQWTASTSREIAFFGSESNVSTALNSLQYQATASNLPATISVTSFVSGAAFNSTTGHFYEIVDNVSSIKWEDARCKAKWGSGSSFSGTVNTASVRGNTSYTNDRCTNATSRRTMGGLRGYLANITTLDEQTFLLGKLTGTGWIGGADIDNEGTFIWMDGPETGQVFWTSALASAGSRRGTFTVSGAISGYSYGSNRFNYFSDGEPNNSGSAEHWAEFGFGSAGVGGSWNDCQNACNRTKYVIEYGENSDTLSGASGVINVNPRVVVGTETDYSLLLNDASAGTQHARIESSTALGTFNAISIQLWIKPKSGQTCAGNLISKANDFALYCVSGELFYALSGAGAWSGVDTNIPIQSGSWSHIALTRIASTTSNGVKIYLNGQNVYTGSADGAGTSSIGNSSSTYLNIGGRNNIGDFRGAIDEVKIWSSDRSSSVVTDMNSNETTTSTLVGYWNFNEGPGSTKVFNQVSGARYTTDLTTSGSPEWESVATTTTSAAYTVVTFNRTVITSRGGWKVPDGVSRVSALIVGGGGGAGFNSGGGGSGGGVSFQGALSISGNVAVKVGMGGRGASSSGTATAGTSSVFGANTANGGNGGVGPSGAGGASVSGSGVGGAGSTSSSTPGGNGGSGPSYSISGSSVNYAGGGGGGGWITSAVGGNGGSGGGGAGGGGASSKTGSNNGASGAANTGGGGGAGSVSSATSGDGGSGIVIIRWITATSPTFSALPAVDTTTALTRYTFRSGGSATSPLTRTYLWQYSSDTGATWSTLQSSTSDSYTTSSLDLGISGSRYKYRVVVTDSDTAGLSITDSSTAYLILNRYPTISPPSSNDSGLLVHLDASQASSYSGSGSMWNDISGNAKHASLGITSGGPAVAGYAAVTCSAPAYTTTNGGAFTFAGNSTAPRNCAWISNSKFSSIGETYTVEMWVNPASSTQIAYSALISTPWITSDKIYFAIAFNGTTTTAGVPDIWGGVFDGSNWYQTPVTGLPINSWSHISLTSSNRQLTLYVNGQARQIKDYSLAKSLSETNKGVLIGRRWDGNDTIDGSIGTVRISSTALTAEQIRQNYYLGSDRYSNSASGSKTSTSTYATTLTETFTVTNGTGTKRFTFTPNNRSGITWDTSTVNSAVLRLSNVLDAGTYYETLTATDSATASTSVGLTITVNKARQASLSIGQYNAYPGRSTYPINVSGGSGTGGLTRTLVDSRTAGCVLTGGMFLTAANDGYCSVQVVKAGDNNWFAETATARINWITWNDAYATRVPSTPTEIVLTHKTEIIRHSYETLTVTSYTDTATVPNTITSARPGQTIRILGLGFDSTDTTSQATFTDNEYADRTALTNDYIQVVVPTGAITGPVIVDTLKGQAVGPTLTILSP